MRLTLVACHFGEVFNYEINARELKKRKKKRLLDIVSQFTRRATEVYKHSSKID